MPETSREMVERFDREDNERRAAAGRKPHGRNWSYLTDLELSEAWGLGSRPFRHHLKGSPALQAIVAGRYVVYTWQRANGSKTKIWRISIEAASDIRNNLNSAFEGKRILCELDPARFVRPYVQTSSALCIAIDGVPTGVELKKKEPVPAKRANEREKICSVRRSSTPFLTIHEIAAVWKVPADAVRRAFNSREIPELCRLVRRHYYGRQYLLEIPPVAFDLVCRHLSRDGSEWPAVEAQ